LGKGKLTLKGRAKTPVFEITRSEVDRNYLGHQLWTLHHLHDGPIKGVRDRLESDGYYDNERIRLRGGDLWRAYELLCPRDKRTISREVLDIAGLDGIVALWIDQGRLSKCKYPGGREKRLWMRGQIKGRYTEQEYMNLESWFNDFGIPARTHHNQLGPIELSLGKEAVEILLPKIRASVHPSMIKKLKPHNL